MRNIKEYYLSLVLNKSELVEIGLRLVYSRRGRSSKLKCLNFYVFRTPPESVPLL